MKIIVLIVWGALLAVSSFAQGDDTDILARREKINTTFQDAKSSPLDPADLKKFAGLKYFGIDPAYRLPARFVKTEKPSIFKMKMTASPKMEYTTAGYVLFTFQGADYKLTAYKKPEGDDAYFIPFTDLTNGHETYESGRYLAFPVPTSDQIVLDFNGAYNPYCAYSPRFSCPIPPPENKLEVAIHAGEKKFKEGH